MLVFLDYKNYAVKWLAAGGSTCANCPWNTRWIPGTDTLPHNDGANCAFFDGHAKWWKVDTLNQTFQAATLPWNNQ